MHCASLTEIGHNSLRQKNFHDPSGLALFGSQKAVPIKVRELNLA